MPWFRKKSRANTLPKLDRRAAWQEVARLVGGTFVEGKRPSADRVVLEHRLWELHLDTFTVSTGQTSVTYTRVRGFFTGRTELKLVVRKRWFTDTILENFGFGGITPGDRHFDRRYVVRGKPQARVRSLFSGALTQEILAQPSLRLEVKRAPRKFRKEMGELTRQVSAYTTGVIKDPPRLAGLFAVVKATFDAMESSGLAQ